MGWIPKRSQRPEMMDAQGHDASILRQVLDDIECVNRFLGGRRTLRSALLPILRSCGGKSLRILDVGTGSADLPRALLGWTAGDGPRIRITAVDRDPTTAAIAAERSRRTPEIEVVCADAFRLPFATNSFDIVMASMFLHHFHHVEVVRLLSEFRRLSRGVVIVNDLRRHRIAWGFIWLVGQLTGRGAMFRHDGPLSVLRGFTSDELRAAARDAGVDAPRVRHRWPYRLELKLPGTS